MDRNAPEWTSITQMDLKIHPKIHVLSVLDTGFALPIAIVAKCEEIINLAQKILIWRQLLAKEKSQVNFFVWRRNRHLRLQVIASCRLMVINVYLNCQLTPQLSTTQFSS